MRVLEVFFNILIFYYLSYSYFYGFKDNQFIEKINYGEIVKYMYYIKIYVLRVDSSVQFVYSYISVLLKRL